MAQLRNIAGTDEYGASDQDPNLYDQFMAPEQQKTFTPAAPAPPTTPSGGPSFVTDPNSDAAKQAAANPGQKPPTFFDPSGGQPVGNLKDAAYANDFVNYWGKQAGVNPSVTNDPGYWTGRIGQASTGDDAAYWITRMMTPEGAPEGQSGPGVGAGSTLPPPAPSPIAAATQAAAAPPPQFASTQDVLGTQAPKSMDDIMAQLKGLFPNGAFNQDIVTRQNDAVRGDINRQRNSTSASDAASLAARGLIGSGPEITAQHRMDANLNDQATQAISTNYANEENSANQRMMTALQTAAGLSAQQAQSAIDAFTASTNRGIGTGNLALGNKSADNAQTLGLGNLALGNMNGVNNYNLGVGQLGLQRDVAENNFANMDTNQLVSLLQLIYGGANTAAGGHQ